VLITKGQRDALGYGAFVRRFRALLLDCFPDAADAVSTDEFDETLRRQCDIARQYGLRSERAIATFLMSAWLLGPEFDRRFPAVNQQLLSSLDEDEKASWMEAFVAALLGRLSQ
jgi:hypothetical protein